jgi:hypothetical protein
MGPKSLDEIDNMDGHESVAWNKLEKPFKLKKLNEYVDRSTEKYNLSPDTANALKVVLKEKLNRKQLQKCKDVGYDKVAGCITEIPVIVFEGSLFSFAHSDTVSPLSSLAPKNRTYRRPVA